MTAASRLVLLPFLQNWDGANLSLRLMVTPQTDPTSPPAPGLSPYATTDFDVVVRAIADPTVLPSPASVAAGETAITLPAMPQAETLFQSLASELPIDSSVTPTDPRTASIRIMKYAPPPYREATGYGQGANPFLLTDDTYRCALKAVPPAGTSIADTAPPLSWGQVLAGVLRQPLLAEAVGLIRAIDIPLPADVVSQGGWVYIDLAPGSPWQSLAGIPGALRLYAARLSPLSGPRPLFTAVQFPVTAAPIPGYDDIFAEAVRYDDGFAKEVYGAQPAWADPFDEDGDDEAERPATERGLLVGCDDSQLVTWFNRQISPGAAPLDAPMGVRGYRIDARETGNSDWVPLTMGETALVLGGNDLGSVQANFPVEVGPNKILGDPTANMWLPSYFAAWNGRPLVGVDRFADRLMGGDDEPEPVIGVPPDIPLRYGTTYDLRIRLCDLSGGGPGIETEALNPGAQPVFTATMKRYVRPAGLSTTPALPSAADPSDPPASLIVTKPRLHYPACLVAGGTEAELEADIPQAATEQRAPGLPDPDVDILEISVEVLRPDVNPEDDEPVYEQLYTIERAFDADGQALLDLEYVDTADIGTMTIPTDGAITIPTSRNVRLNLTPICSDKPDYFGADDVRRGETARRYLRSPAQDERGLFSLPRGWAAEGFYLQPTEPGSRALVRANRAGGRTGQGAENPIARLASALDLDHVGASLRARPGQRCLFGLHSSLNAVIGPDGGSVRFATKSEVTSQWIVAVVVNIERDWTWDGLSALRIERDGNQEGRVSWRQSAPHEVAHAAANGETTLIFLDAIDPEPADGSFPRPLQLKYTAIPEYKVAPTQEDGAEEVDLTLPVARPPRQVPKIVSAGIALSPYLRDPAYSRSEERTRLVWLEFDRPPDDPNDSLFARMLATSPDPVLTGDLTGDPTLGNTPLPIDRELIRTIIPEQADDRSGLGAMQKLLPTNSPRHFMLPLPQGLPPEAPELFGFFLYEFRVGHAEMWSTAQGRYGRPLQVAGIQHAPPPLTCGVTRSTQRLTVSAEFADPVKNGRSVQPVVPRTDLWVLLYVQAVQADDEDRRNVLLGRRQLAAPRRTRQPFDDRSFGFTATTEPAGQTSWSAAEITSLLADITLGPDAPLSCLVVETLPGEVPHKDPLGAHLGYERILRASPLTKVPEVC
ncbi:hypothetical protein [Ruegeria atlantica]|uniref:hypothetical protein n=1 Tax=Ruegeria atlantica TaxID=81569 RepID=UPI002494D15C|nr:hypothetical protein [Ruegeria atlantica]